MKYLLYPFFLIMCHFCNAQLNITVTINGNDKDTLIVKEDGKIKKGKEKITVNKRHNTFTVNNKTNDPGYSVVLTSAPTNTSRFGIRIPDSVIRPGKEIIVEFDDAGNFKGPVIGTKPMSFPVHVLLKKKTTSGEKTIRTWPLDATDDSVSKPRGNTEENVVNTPSPAPQNVKAIGIAIHDANNLFSPDNLSTEEFIKILQYYNSSTISDVDSISISYKGNPFLSRYVDSILEMKAALNSTGPLSFLTSSLSSVGGLDVTNIADGLAKFLVKRAKEELNLAFFEKFKNTLADPRYRDLPTLFPHTVSLLNTIGEEVYNYDRYLQNLRESFKIDLKELHKHLPGIIDNHQVFFDTYPVAEASLRTACYIAEALEDESHPGDILANYPVRWLDSLATAKDTINKYGKDLKGAIQTLQIISSSVRDTASGDSATYWVSLKQVRDLVNNKALFKIYLGLIYQEAKVKYSGVEYSGGTLINFLNDIATKYDQKFDEYDACRKYVLRFGEKANVISTMIKTHAKPANDSTAFELYAKYFKASVELIEYATLAAELPVINKVLPNFPSRFNAYFDVAYATSDLVVEIVRKNYSAAINQVVHIYDLVKANPLEFHGNRVQPAMRTLNAPILENQSQLMVKYNAGIEKIKLDNGGVITVEQKESFEKTFWTTDRIRSVSQRSGQLLIKYGAFVSSVAVSKNSDEIANAIEAFALPSGSARIKRVSDFNVSINAYIGLFAGFERIKGADDSKFKINTYGVTAPLGVAASWGNRQFYGFAPGGKWSYSVFLSLIDVGAVAAFRFKDTLSKSASETVVADKVPTIQLRDIFSPGLFLSAGIPNSPISINIGAQAGPNLRKITSVAGGTSTPKDFGNKIYWRYSLSICVDIPVFNLYTKSN